jgi:hypothetical protein
MSLYSPSSSIATVTAVGSLNSYKRAASFPPVMKLLVFETSSPRKTLQPLGCVKRAKL